jgi:hypothetical protein
MPSTTFGTSQHPLDIDRRKVKRIIDQTAQRDGGNPGLGLLADTAWGAVHAGLDCTPESRRPIRGRGDGVERYSAPQSEQLLNDSCPSRCRAR